MNRKLTISFLLAIFLVGVFSFLVLANPVNYTSLNNPDNEKISAKGWLNLGDGAISAVGYGVPSSKAKSPAQASLTAKRAAVVDAQRNLAEAIKGVQIDSETTLQELEVASDTVRSKVSAFISGYTIIDEQELANGAYRVTIQVRMGSGLNQLIQESRPQGNMSFPAPSSNYVDTDLNTYTGLLIEARHLKVDPVWAPKIFVEGKENGTPIFGGADYAVSFDYLNEVGLAGYLRAAADIQAADNGQSRAGSNPLKIKALRTINHNQDFVISQEDTDRLLAANQKFDFLHNSAVAIKCKRATY